MKLKLESPKDEAAILQACNLATAPAIFSTFIADVATCLTLPQTDFEITILKTLLPVSYRSNPSLFASRCLEKAEGFRAAAGFYTAGLNTHITIRLLRREKDPYERRTSVTPTIKPLIKKWLALNLPRLETLSLPIETIPPFLKTHPEQLSYQIYRETNNRISIKRHKTKWTIQRR